MEGLENSPIMTSPTIGSAIKDMTTTNEANNVAEVFASEAKISVEDTTIETPKKCRKDVENNGFELIFALCACDSSINNKDDIMNASFDKYNSKLLGCSQNEFDKYKKDVDSRKPKVIEKYITNFKR